MCLDRGAWGEVVAAIFVALLLVWLYFFSYKPLLRSFFGDWSCAQTNVLGMLLSPILKLIETSEAARSVLEEAAKYRSLLAGFLKVSISFWQISGSFMNVFSVECEFLPQHFVFMISTCFC